MGSAIGQGSGVYYSRKEKEGGAENLKETLDIGDFTGENIINQNRANDKIRQLGVGGVREDVYTDGGYTLQNDPLGGFAEAWFDFNKFGIGMGFGAGAGSFSVAVIPSGFSLVKQLGIGVSQIILVSALSVDFGYPVVIKSTNDSPNALPELKAFTTPDQSTVLHYSTIKTVDDKTAYDEKFGTIFNNTSNATWQTIIVPTAPINKVIDILITNTIAALRNGGVRKVGSGLARIGVTNSDSIMFTTTTNESGEIEIFSSLFADIDFRLIGIHGV